MPLNLSTNDADFTPYIKYNAKAGRFYIRPENSNEEVEVQNPRLAFDFANIKTGWLYYEEGSGPEKFWDPSPIEMASKPAGPRKFKRGFEVMVFGPDPYPGLGTVSIGLREFSSTARNCISAIMSMFEEYEAGIKENPGKVPFFGCTGVKAIPGNYGTNYEPGFKLIAWIERAKIPAFDEHKQAGAHTAMIQAASKPVGEAFARQDNPPQAWPDQSKPFEKTLDDEIPF